MKKEIREEFKLKIIVMVLSEWLDKVVEVQSKVLYNVVEEPEKADYVITVEDGREYKLDMGGLSKLRLDDLEGYINNIYHSLERNWKYLERK